MRNQSSESHSSSIGHALTSPEWLNLHYLAMQPEYEAMLRWVGVLPGWHVLDAGCGDGSYLPLLADLVGIDGQVSAMDLAPENVQSVEARLAQRSWAAPVETRVGSILSIPYADQTFDAVWCANTQQYLTDEELRTALKELRRVVRHGGLIAIKDFDNTAWQIQPMPATLIWHWVEAAKHQGNVAEAGCLRTIQLPRWMREAGLTDIRQKPTLMERFQPLRSVERLYLSETLSFLNATAHSMGLPSDELEIWSDLTSRETPKYLLNDPDFHNREIQTVFVGSAP